MVAIGTNSSANDRKRGHAPFPIEKFFSKKGSDPFFVFSIILIIGFLLRFCGIDFGLPDHRFHPDESVKVKTILGMLSRESLDPRTFLHPSLLIYLTMAVHKVWSAIGLLSDWSLPAQIIEAGRFVSLLAGCLSIFFTFLIASNFERASPWLSAAIVAIAPLSVTVSRYLKEDSLMLPWVLGALYFSQRAIDKDDPRDLIGAGVMVGLASASKYPGLVSAIFPLLVPWIKSQSIKPNTKFLLWGLAAALIACLVLFCCSPFIFIDFNKFWFDFNQERMHMRIGHGEKISIAQSFGLHGLLVSLLRGVGPIVVSTGIVGLALLIKNFKKKEILLVVGFSIFYILAETARAKNDRYLLPTLPLLAIASSITIGALSAKRIRVLATTILLSLLLLKSTVLAFSLEPDTRELAGNWIQSNIQPGSVIVVPFKAYSPQLPESKFKITYLKGDRVSSMSRKKFRTAGADYLIMSSLFYDRYLTKYTARPLDRRRIRKILGTYESIAQFYKPAGRYQYHNPDVQILRIPK